MTQHSFPGIALILGAVAIGLSGCVAPDGRFDWDFRSSAAGNTADAVRTATAERPRADDRGVISYPGYQVVVARRNDTVQGIAERLGVGALDLARTNALPHDMALRGGEVLVLPQRVAEPRLAGVAAPAAPGTVDVGAIAITALDSVAPTPAAPRAAEAAPAPARAADPQPVRHKVRRGDTAYTVARLYNVAPRALAEWNGLPPDLSLREGQTLLIPPADGTPPRPRPTEVAMAPGQGSPTPPPPSAARPLPAENPQRAGGGAGAAAPASPSVPVSAPAGKLAMPADGKVVRAYQKGRYDGIGIGAAAGSPVRAAADGTVAAITRDTEQVPILVIRHADNLLTVYANVDGVTLQKGASVKRGQQIGKVRAGTPPFLHFEVRRGSDSIDPMTMLQ